MGVNTRIELPPNVRLDTVAEVTGALLGLPVVQTDESYGRPVHVNEVRLRSIDGLPTCVHMELKGEMAGGMTSTTLLYHFEFGRGGCRGLMPRSYALWIALGRRLVDFFGGRVDYADCDDINWDYEVPWKDDEANCPEDGGPWQDLHDRIAALEPLSAGEIRFAGDFAAYKD